MLDYITFSYINVIVHKAQFNFEAAEKIRLLNISKSEFLSKQSWPDSVQVHAAN
jgi:hypothetical protein